MDELNVNDNLEQNKEIFDLNMEGDSAKKSGFQWPILMAIIIVVVAIASVVAYWIINNLSTEADEHVITIVDVEREASKTNAMPSIEQESFGRSASIEVDINDFALNVVTGYNQDLKFLKELDGVKIDTVLESNDGMMRFLLDLYSKDGELIPIEVIVDSNTESVYISSELFAGNYLKFDISSLAETDIDVDMIQVFLDILLNSDISDRYFDSFLELMSVQDSKTEILISNGVREECVVYTAQINMDSVLDLVVNLLEEIGADNDTYSKLLDEIIVEIREFENDDESPEVISWCVYTNKDGEIIGRDISCDDEQILHYLTTMNGEDIGFEFRFGQLEIIGNGVLQKGLLDSTFIVSEYDIDYLKICTDSFDMEAVKTGRCIATIEM